MIHWQIVDGVLRYDVDELTFQNLEKLARKSKYYQDLYISQRGLTLQVIEANKKIQKLFMDFSKKYKDEIKNREYIERVLLKTRLKYVKVKNQRNIVIAGILGVILYKIITK